MKFKVGDKVFITPNVTQWSDEARKFYHGHSEGTVIKVNTKSMWYPYEVDIPTVGSDGAILRDSTIWTEEELNFME